MAKHDPKMTKVEPARLVKFVAPTIFFNPREPLKFLRVFKDKLVDTQL